MAQETDPLFELLPTAAVVAELDGEVITANQAFREMLAWDPATRPRISVYDFVEPEAFALVADVQRRLQSGEVDHFDVVTHLTGLDGRTIIADHRGVVVDHQGRKALLVTLVPTDTAFDSQNPFRRALDSQRELIAEWSIDGTILYCNQRYREFFHRDDSVIGRNLDEFVSWPPGNSRIITVQRLMDGAKSQTNTRHYDDGTSIEWTNTLLTTEAGDVISVVSVGRDVTDRVRAEEAIRHQEARFRTMVTYIWDSILLVDRDGRLIESTVQYRRDLDYEPDFWSRADLIDVIHPDDQPRALQALADLVAAGRNAQAAVELRALRADGSVTVLDLNGVNLLDDPTVNAVILTVRNIDDRKRIENELAERHAEAEAQLRHRLAFIARVSHELRNPLHGMLALSELLTRAPLEPELAHAASALFRQSSTLRRIVDDLLDFAQLEIGNLRTRHHAVDLELIVADALAIAKGSAVPGVRIHAAPVPTAWRWITGDDDRVRQALGNLLSNACKHTHAGEVFIEITEGASPGTARVRVLDTGDGIDVDDIDDLFEPYQRGHNSGGATGAGLGLAIVKGLVEAMHGHVGAAPRAEGGAEFWMELPLTAPEEETSGDSVERRSPGRRGPGDDRPLRVLVLDDDPVNRLVATMQLQRLGLAAEVAEDGEAAWEMLCQADYDVAFIDVQLPGIDGLEVVRRMRATDRPQPLMAVMTAGTTAADHEAAMAAGADAFVPKPATLADIADVIDQRGR